MKIYKYTLKVLDIQEIRIPDPHKFLSFQAQNGQLVVWYEVNENPSSDCYKEVEFIIVGTGHSRPSDTSNGRYVYLGTAQLNGFVWHLYTLQLFRDLP